MNLLELEWAEAKLSIEDPQILPGGPMVPYLGGQLTFEEVKRYYEGRQGYPPGVDAITTANRSKRS